MIFIPDIFSGWLAGARQANADNWQDLANYNNVLGGQLNNAFAMDTYDPSVRAAWDKGYNADLSTIQNAMTTDQLMKLFNLGNAAGLDEAKVAATLSGYNAQNAQNVAGQQLVPTQTAVNVLRLNAMMNALNQGQGQTQGQSQGYNWRGFNVPDMTTPNGTAAPTQTNNLQGSTPNALNPQGGPLWQTPQNQQNQQNQQNIQQSRGFGLNPDDYRIF